MRKHEIVALLLAATIAACSRSSHDEATGEAVPAIAVKAAPVKVGDIADVLTATGETVATSTARLGAPVAGRVTFLPLQAGDEVVRGQVLARILSIENEAALNGFALLRGADSSRAGERFDSEPLEQEIARRAVGVRSPLAGVITERLHNAGEQVAQGESLLELFDPTSIVVIAQAPAERARHIVRGMTVAVAGAGFEASGRIDAVLSTIVPGALTVPVRVSFADRKLPRLLHAAVECRITIAEHQRALLIPRSALLAPTRGTSSDVLVVEAGHAHRKAVTVGLRSGDEIEIVSGLTGGDRVIVEGGYGLPDGAAVVIDERSAPEGSAPSS